MRDSFLLYTEYSEHIKLLNLEERGQLLTAIMAYAAGAEPPDMDTATAMAFSFIKSRMDRDAEKYNQTVEARKEAGKRGGRPKQEEAEKAKKANGFSEKAKKANGFSEKQTKAKKPDNDPDHDNDPVNEKDKKDIVAPVTSDGGHRPYEYSEIIDYLNAKAGTSFRGTSKDTRKHIKARFDEGYTLDDFKAVIDHKAKEWKGTEMAGYLRPCTLFGTKFEAYLNQRGAPEAKKTAFSNFEERDYSKSFLDGLVGR